ncbi:hypothetical protein AB1K70_20245 [Bremerella sp. JC770]|uniref:hypothetical protein n=1 Tax=Bremerella sp. JC770 TaxID=3232137 RepID=UPI00345836AE
MLHYCLNNGISFEFPREVLVQEDAERLHKLRRSLGHADEYPFLDGKVKIEVRPQFDADLTVNFLGYVKDKWFPIRTQVVAATEEFADISWGFVESVYKGIGDLPGFRSLDLPAPQRPANAPWSATIRYFQLFDDSEHERLSGDLDVLQCYIAQAWYERVVFGPPENVGPTNRCY